MFRDMDHANVLRIIGHCVETPPFLTVLESCPEVSCFIMSTMIVCTLVFDQFSFLELLQFGFGPREKNYYLFHGHFSRQTWVSQFPSVPPAPFVKENRL